MELLHGLEQKIRRILALNGELKEQLALLSEENKGLKERVAQLESSLLQESSASLDLNKERDQIRASIDELLESLDALDASSGSQTVSEE